MWKRIKLEDWGTSKRMDLDDVQKGVSTIVERVRREGDSALIDLTHELDGVDIEEFVILEEDFDLAYQSVDPSLIEALRDAFDRIKNFHKEQMPPEIWYEEAGPGIVLGMKSTPLNRAGIYVPGGKASYPSTVMMGAIPPQVAGVPSICCCSPPPIAPITLVALQIAGVKEVYAIGGAQAIAAMAIGTETVRPVQKIVGPGNVYVTAAKMMLRNTVEIDFPAGPSEIVVVADGTANPRFIAADILAQAEHDPMASCALITDDPDMPTNVWSEIEAGLDSAPRREIIEKALMNSGYMLVKDVEEAIEVSNQMAPEHLSIQVENAWQAVDAVQNAGAIFIGEYSAVASGDYASGTNHILPTAGYPSLYSGLDVHHFLKRTSVQMLSKEGLKEISQLVESLARAEGLHEHARSIRVRAEDTRSNDDGREK